MRKKKIKMSGNAEMEVFDNEQMEIDNLLEGVVVEKYVKANSIAQGTFLVSLSK